jgi:hypothetical protein
MKIGYVFLARYAETNPDGTVNAVGCDFESVRAKAFPAAFPVAIVAKLTEMEAFEKVGEKLSLLLQIVNPAGEDLLDPPLVAILEPQRLDKKISIARSGTSRVVWSLGGLPFATPGKYELRLTFESGTKVLRHTVELNAEVSQ